MVAKNTLEGMGRPPKELSGDTYLQRMGILLRNAREAKSISLDELQTKLARNGVALSTKTLSAYELGNREIRIADFPAFAKALGCGIHDLIPNR